MGSLSSDAAGDIIYRDDEMRIRSDLGAMAREGGSGENGRGDGSDYAAGGPVALHKWRSGCAGHAGRRASGDEDALGSSDVMTSSGRSPDDRRSRSGDQQDGSHGESTGELSDGAQVDIDRRQWGGNGVVMSGEINDEGNPSHTHRG